MAITGRDMGTFIVQYGTNAERLALDTNGIKPLTAFYETDTTNEYKFMGAWVAWPGAAAGGGGGGLQLSRDSSGNVNGAKIGKNIVPPWWQQVRYSQRILADSLGAANGASPGLPPDRATVVLSVPTVGSAGLNANGLFIAAADAAPLCVRGNGTIRYYSADNSVSWQAFGDTEGARVVISTAATIYTLPSGTAGSELYIQSISRVHPTLGDTSNTINVTGAYRLRNGSTLRTWLGATHLLTGSSQTQINFSISTLRASDVWASRAEWSASFASQTVVALGTNDVTDAASALQAVTDVSNICKLASGQGSEVVIALLMPYDGSTSTQHAAFAQFNREMRKFAKTINAVVIDLFTPVCAYQGPSATATITQATPGVITVAGSNFKETQPFMMATTGTLPAPLQPNTVYYAKNTNGTTSFSYSNTPRGSAIATTTAGTGTHTLTAAPGNGVFETGNTIDGLHLSGQGCYRAAKYAAIPALIKSLNYREPLIPGHVPYNASTAVYGNLLVNSQMNGSVAAANTGMSGFLPTSWTGIREAGTNITVAWSVPDSNGVAAPDGYPGKMVIGSISNVGGADSESIRFRPSSFITTGWAAGDRVQLEGFITLAGSGIQWIEISEFTQGAAGSTQARNSMCPFADTSNVAAIGDLGSDTVVIPIKTAPLVIESDATSLMMYIIVGMLAGGTATLGISQTLNLHKVSAP